MSILSLSDVPMPSRCKVCGAATSPTAKFCGECGATQPSHVAGASTIVPEDTTPNSAEEQHRFARLTSVLVGVVIGAVVLTLAAAGLLFWIPQSPVTAKGQSSVPAQQETATPAPAPIPAAPEMTNAEATEVIGKQQREAVRSDLFCKSYERLADGRLFEMTVRKEGARLAVTGYALQGSGEAVAQLWDTTFSQDTGGPTGGAWASYNDAQSIKTIIIFDDEGSQTNWNMNIRHYGEQIASSRIGGKCTPAQ